jgi:hypothetical protein
MIIKEVVSKYLVFVTCFVMKFHELSNDEQMLFSPPSKPGDLSDDELLINGICFLLLVVDGIKCL